MDERFRDREYSIEALLRIMILIIELSIDLKEGRSFNEYLIMDRKMTVILKSKLEEIFKW